MSYRGARWYAVVAAYLLATALLSLLLWVTGGEPRWVNNIPSAAIGSLAIPVVEIGARLYSNRSSGARSAGRDKSTGP